MAARPRTLPAAVAPVLVGTALAGHRAATCDRLAFVAALLGALFIQVGTNLSNDYSDARRGADTEDRLGPGARDRRRARAAARRCSSRRTSRSGSPCCAASTSIAVAGWVLLRDRRRLDPRRRALHRRPAPVRLRGPRRGLRLPLLRRRRRHRLLLRADARSCRGRRSCSPCPVGLLASRDPRRQQRPRPRDRPARRQAHARRPTRAASARGRSTRRCSTAPSSPRRVPWRARVAVGVAAAAAG